MAETTNISWCDMTFNPWIGCTKVSTGAKGACEHCYAEVATPSRAMKIQWGNHPRHRTSEETWKQPLRWNRKAAREGTRPFVFCASLADVFDNQVPPEWRRDLFDLIRATPNLTWLLLTKRPQNIVRLFRDTLDPAYGEDGEEGDWYLPDVWPSNAAILCTVVTQAEADRDIPVLLAAKAAIRPAFAGVSMEPLMGKVDLTRLSTMHFRRAERLNALTGELSGLLGDPAGCAQSLDWVITGGETDQGGAKARPSSARWFEELRDQCAMADVPFHFKQWGEWAPGFIGEKGPFAFGDYDFDSAFWPSSIHVVERGRPRHFDMFGSRYCGTKVGKKAAGRLLDGVLHDARPQIAA